VPRPSLACGPTYWISVFYWVWRERFEWAINGNDRENLESHTFSTFEICHCGTPSTFLATYALEHWSPHNRRGRLRTMMITTHEIASEFNLNTHLLTTNSIPTKHDRSIIYSTLSSINKNISQAEIDIAQLKKVLEERITDRAALIQYRDSLAAVVSLLHQLPLEIFGQIFAYATLDDRRFPISASHVCQLWRRASLANSDLWTTIWIGNRCQKEYMALFIQRSQSRPMSLKYSENLPLQSLPNISTTLSDIGCDCRWKEIHVHPSWDYLPKLLSKSWEYIQEEW